MKRYTEDELHVHDPGTWENEDGPLDWYAVSDDSGIIAYFGTEELAWVFIKALTEASA